MKISIKAPSRPIISVILATFIALAGTAASGTVVAHPDDQVLSKTVTYDDLNLESEKGAKVLYARLRHAAQDVCSPFESRELSRKQIWHTCVDNALASAVRQLNNPRVTALHNQSAKRASMG